MAWIRKGIYESSLNDILEAFFFVNLCIFAAITDQNNIIGSSRQTEVGYFFIGVALAGFGCIILYHIYLKINSVNLCHLMHREKRLGHQLMMAIVNKA